MQERPQAHRVQCCNGLRERSVAVDRAKLTEETELVEFRPPIDSDPALEEIDGDAVDRDGVAGWGDAEEWAAMRAGDRPPGSRPCHRLRTVVDFEMEIRKGGTEAEDHALEPLSAADEVG
jgi:hypothetical protein